MTNNIRNSNDHENIISFDVLKQEIEDLNREISKNNRLLEEKSVEKNSLSEAEIKNLSNLLKGDIAIYLNKTSSSFNKKIEKSVEEAEEVIKNLKELSAETEKASRMLKTTITTFEVCVLVCLFTHLIAHIDTFFANLIGFVLLLSFVVFFIYQLRHW